MPAVESPKSPLNPAKKDVLTRIAEYFRIHSGWKVNEREWHKFEGAVEARMSALKLPSMEMYYQKLAISSLGPNEEFNRLANLIVNSETYFFRDQGQYEALKTIILPELIEANRDRKQLRIWSAGCATGEEPYSIAILLTQLLHEYRQWKLTIIGSDISFKAIEKAQKGIYRENSLRDVKPSERHLYFKKDGSDWVLDQKYRSMVRFYQGNLVDDYFPSMTSEYNHIDLIICRNVFIYFHNDAIRSVMEKFEKTLLPNRILLLGHGEAAGVDHGHLTTQTIKNTMIYSKPV